MDNGKDDFVSLVGIVLLWVVAIGAVVLAFWLARHMDAWLARVLFSPVVLSASWLVMLVNNSAMMRAGGIIEAFFN